VTANGSSKDDLTLAHAHSTRNHSEVLASKVCGCFYCLSIFAPSDIQKWIKERNPVHEETAICPKCGIDSVIGSDSGYAITVEFLRRMHERWFVPSN
jgi:hypothetical protein